MIQDNASLQSWAVNFAKLGGGGRAFQWVSKAVRLREMIQVGWGRCELPGTSRLGAQGDEICRELALIRGAGQ